MGGLYALATVAQSLDTVIGVHRRLGLDGVIALGSGRADVSGWCDVRAIAQPFHLPTIVVRSYDLSDAADLEVLTALDIDVLLSVGWQRVVPSWLLARCRRGAVGVHGSPWGITRGRGRSPQTWALILGSLRFEVSLFQLTPGVDDGPVLASRSFDLTERDDIVTAFKKTSAAAVDMFLEVLCRDELGGVPQRADEARYFPQRRPQDGGLDWRLSTGDIDRFIRALTRPYPGAFTTLEGSRVTVWRARAFGQPEGRVPGEVVRTFLDGSFVVRTGDSTLLVEDADTSVPIEEGSVFESVDATVQYARIVARHRARHPDRPIVSEILRRATHQ